MANNSIDCYVVPAKPLPLLIPLECVAEVVKKPDLQQLSQAPAKWMQGYLTWENQRVPVLSYSALHDSSLDESKKRNAQVVVLNPIPDAARKAFSGLLCFGAVKTLPIDTQSAYGELPDGVDRRYVEAVVKLGEEEYLVPKLAALGVAFSYF
ncbi:MAG: chemotaxis protein CheW [Pseudomonadota bacterium]